MMSRNELTSVLLKALRLLGPVLFAVIAVPAAALGAYFLAFFGVAIIASYGHGDLSVPLFSAMISAVVAGVAAVYGIMKLFKRS